MITSSILIEYYREKQSKKHTKINIELLAIEMYKFREGLTPLIMGQLFFAKENKFNLRYFQILESSYNKP